jgi:hypothetical protein
MRTSPDRPTTRVSGVGSRRRASGAAIGAAFGRKILQGCHRCDEAVSTSRHVGHKAQVWMAVAEHLAQPCDMHAEVRLLDGDVGPDAGGQFLLADHLPGALDQRDQDVEGAAAQPHRHAPI